MPVLPVSFYARDPVSVARDLLGRCLVRDESGTRLIGRIVETEAYLASEDPASHSYFGRKRRNAAMFGPPGRAYVYAIHRYHCLNVVTEAEEVPSAVLIRAVEPLHGQAIMQARRNTDHVTNLTSGPGKLCQAFGIDRTSDHWDLTQGEQLWLAAARPEHMTIITSPRIGVTSARERLLRFYDETSPHVSRGPRYRGLRLT